MLLEMHFQVQRRLQHRKQLHPVAGASSAACTTPHLHCCDTNVLGRARARPGIYCVELNRSSLAMFSGHAKKNYTRPLFLQGELTGSPCQEAWR